MPLVLFMFAIEHVARVQRIISMPGGNALLVGLGGSGRQSTARLAAHLASVQVFQVDLSKSYTPVEWREDMKQLLMRAGGEGMPLMLLFTDTQASNHHHSTALVQH